MSIASSSLIRYEDELKRRLEKLSRVYDFGTMKIFMAVECLGEEKVCSTFDAAKRVKWDTFLTRKEACRLDLQKHEKIRLKYQDFLLNIPREEQGKQFHEATVALFRKNGASDPFSHTLYQAEEDLSINFCGHLCRLFERKITSWFDAFDAVSVKLTGHVKVSNFVRVLSGQIDALCQKDGYMYCVIIKVTGMDTPRPLDLAELSFCKTLIVQNGLAEPNNLRLCLLTLHLTSEKPILRLWEYQPTTEMDEAIAEADIDKMIDAGKLSQHHEFWTDNVHIPNVSYVHDTSTFGSSRGQHSEKYS